MRVHLRPLGVPPHVSPPPAVAGPAKGYFICTNLSTEFPVAHPPKSGMCGLAFSHLSAALPGHMLRPFPLPVKGLDKQGEPLGNIFVLINARECTWVRAHLPLNPGLPRLRQNFFKGTCLSNTWSMFVLLILYRLLQDLFILLSRKV